MPLNQFLIKNIQNQQKIFNIMTFQNGIIIDGKEAREEFERKQEIIQQKKSS